VHETSTAPNPNWSLKHCRVAFVTLLGLSPGNGVLRLNPGDSRVKPFETFKVGTSLILSLLSRKKLLTSAPTRPMLTSLGGTAQPTYYQIVINIPNNSYSL
jgi:hypothetical protein